VDLSALSLFNLVASHGGFGRASRATGQPKATLSRRVRELEESLGVRLIERGSHSLRLTDEGALLHARTESLLGEIAEAGQDVSAGVGRARGRLRVSAPVFFAHTAMGRVAAGFAAAYPDVQLEVIAEDRFVDLVDDGFDIVIRVNPRPDENLVGRCFLRAPLVVAAAASLPRPRQASGKRAAETVPAILRTGIAEPSVWNVTDGRKDLTFHPRGIMWFSTPLLVRDAVRAGAGAALLPRSVIAEELASGQLVSWGTAREGHVEAWVLHASRRLVSPKVSAFVGYLCDYYAAMAVP
jgi:DNA-binding transcriptional LysR family regulator